MLDLAVRGATVVDGTGGPPARADVGIAGGRIAAVGVVAEPARRTLHAEGAVVCPGFIDIHTHYDAQFLWDATASPSVLHGVTSVLGGNCGFSIAPLAAGDAAYVQAMMAVVEGIPLSAMAESGPWDWTSFAEYLARVDQGLAANAGFLVGHSAVRRAVMGDDATRSEASPAQLSAMVELVMASVSGGALGFSSSLGEGHTDGEGRAVPSRAATHEELVTLAGALRDLPGTTLEFIPAVGPIDEDRMRLMADMSLAANRPLNWNLLGSLASEEIYEQQLGASDLAARRGAHVVALALPDMMRMRATHVLPGLPGWPEVAGLNRQRRRAAVADAARRAELRAGAEKVARRSLGVLSDFALMEISSPESTLYGQSLGEIAQRRGGDAIDVLLDDVLVDDLALSVVLPSLTPSLGRSDEGWRARVAVWKDPRVMLGGSDAGAHLDLMCHANYPTVVLGEVVRRARAAVAAGGRRDDDRSTRPALRAPSPWSRGRRVVGRSRRLRPGARGYPGHRVAPRPPRRGRTPLRRGRRHPSGPGRGAPRGGGRGADRRPPGPGAALGRRHRHRVAGCAQAVDAPSMTSVVPLTVAASSEAR